MMTPENKKTLFTYLFHTANFYLIWFILLFAAVKHDWSLALGVSMLMMASQLAWQKLYVNDTEFLLPIGSFIGICGVLIDAFLSSIGFIHFIGQQYFIVPWWIALLWIEFGIVYYSTFQVYFTRYYILSVLGFVGFPAAYYAGVRIGAAQLYYGDFSVMLYGCIWMILLPSLSYILHRVFLHATPDNQ